MRVRRGVRFGGIAVSVVVAVACSAGNKDSSFTTGPQSGSGGFGNTGGGQTGTGGWVTDPSAGGITNFGGSLTRDNPDGGGDGQCDAVAKPEEIIQYEPVAIFIMQDRSGSMVTGFPPPASPDGWKNSSAAVTAFVNDPSSAGISVGLGSFPPMQGATDCAGGSDCGTPIVNIAPLPGNAQAMISGMQSATPNNPIALTPTECGLRGMVHQCTTFQQTAGMQCVGVLVTDGTPTQCDGNDVNLAKILSDSVAATGIKTFVIGLPGSDINRLNTLAQAGGTNQAIDVSGGVQTFIKALNDIRGQVSVGTALPCQWKIPAPPAGKTFDKNLVNIRFTPKGGTPSDFGYVTQADCSRTDNAWYFDDENNPTQVLVCPTTCDMLKAQSGAEIDVAFGCKRKPGIPK